MLQNMQLMCIWYSNTSKSELTTRQLGKSYLAAPNASVPACTSFWCHIWQCLALTLLCRSRKVVLLGSWFSFIWLQWHLCDRGFLGYVVFHWTLCSHLLGKGKQQVKSEKQLQGYGSENRIAAFFKIIFDSFLPVSPLTSTAALTGWTAAAFSWTGGCFFTEAAGAVSFSGSWANKQTSGI